MSDYIDFPPGERPEIEVLVDGTWYSGELLAWSRPGATTWPTTPWWGHVSYLSGLSEWHRKTVPSDRIRPDQPPVHDLSAQQFPAQGWATVTQLPGQLSP